MYNRSSFLFEIGWHITFTKGPERYGVFLDPRSKLLVGNKKKKLKKLKVGDMVGDLTISEIKRPFIEDHIIGIKKLKKISLIELSQFDIYRQSPKVFTEEELANLLVKTTFEFARNMFDGLELYTDDGQRVYLPFNTPIIPANVILYEERKDIDKKCKVLEVY